MLMKNIRMKEHPKKDQISLAVKLYNKMTALAGAQTIGYNGGKRVSIFGGNFFDESVEVQRMFMDIVSDS